MSGFVWNLISFVVAIGLLVTVHEFGHFWVARKNNVLVKRFSIGFGKAIYRWRDKQGTEFVIAMIPLGGYVRMLDERVDPVLPQFKDLSFNSKTVGQRMAIIAAGPIANFLFAILLLWGMYLIGVPNIKPVIGQVTAESIAAKAGVPSNTQITAINGEPAEDWRAISLLLVEQVGSPAVDITVQQLEGSDQSYQLDLTDWVFDPDKQSVFGSLGLEPLRPEVLNEISQIQAGSAAEAAGLQLGDKLVSVDGKAVADWNSVVTLVQNNPEKPLLFGIERAGQSMDILVTPQSRETADGFHQGYLGVSPKVLPWPEHLLFTQQYGPVQAALVGVEKTWQLVRLSFSMIGKFIFGDISVKHLSGPISIAQGAGSSADIGLIAFISFLALISVNLGVINLLPLPILDGGHLMYLVLELIRGKPVSEKAQELGFRIGALLLLTLMGIALLNDISRL